LLGRVLPTVLLAPSRCTRRDVSSHCHASRRLGLDHVHGRGAGPHLHDGPHGNAVSGGLLFRAGDLLHGIAHDLLRSAHDYLLLAGDLLIAGARGLHRGGGSGACDILRRTDGLHGTYDGLLRRTDLLHRTDLLVADNHGRAGRPHRPPGLAEHVGCPGCHHHAAVSALHGRIPRFDALARADADG